MPRGDVVIVDLPSPPGGWGHEQAGRRPALVIGDDLRLSTIIVVPFTGRLSARRFPYAIYVHPSEENGLRTASILLIFHLQEVDRRRVRDTIGCLERDLLEDANRELRRMLSL